MICRLKEIATIKTGVFLPTVKDGDIVYLQANDLNEQGQINEPMLRYALAQNKRTDKHLIQSGDILFVSKSKTIATTYRLDLPMVASTSFFVIRLKANADSLLQILPEYVAWYINQPDTQKVLRNQAAGTSNMIAVSMGPLEELEIILPQIEKQQTILKIAALRTREKSILHQIDSLRERKMNLQIKEALAI